MEKPKIIVLVVSIALSTIFVALSMAQSVESPLDSFDIVWQAISQRFYDPAYNGVDWESSKSRFRPIVGQSAHPDSFYKYVNLMLFELGVSHTGVVPTDDPKQLGEATVFGDGTIADNTDR